MPTITFASPKGGAGKTTASMLLATELALAGASVRLIDADPNHPIWNWREGGGRAENLTIERNDSEEAIVDAIYAAAEQAQFVIVDLEGTANMGVSHAVAASDLVIIPSQPSLLDQAEAGKAVALVRTQEKLLRQRAPTATIAARILMTRTNPAIRTKSQQRMEENLVKHGIPRLETEIVERAAYRAIFEFRATLNDLSSTDVSGLPAARANARRYRDEVLDVLGALQPIPKEEAA